MKTKNILFFTLCIVILIPYRSISKQVFPQNELNQLKTVSSTNQTWSMELRAIYNSKTFIDDLYIVSPENISCKFSIAYNHGQAYFHEPYIKYSFEYTLYRNGSLIDSYTEWVDSNQVNQYVAYHEFTNLVTVAPNDIISGGLKIIYYKPSNNGSDGYIVLPVPIIGSPSLPYQPTPNSINFNYNTSDVTINSLFQPQCPTIMSTTYWDIVQATNSIKLNSGFSVSSENKNFSAQIINLSLPIIPIKPPLSKAEPVALSITGLKTGAPKKQLSIFPNPASGKFSIKNTYNETVYITIYNNYGNVIKNKKVNPGEIYKVTVFKNLTFLIIKASTKKEFLSKQILLLKKN